MRSKTLAAALCASLLAAPASRAQGELTDALTLLRTAKDGRVISFNAVIQAPVIRMIASAYGPQSYGQVVDIKLVGGRPVALISTLPVLATCIMPAPNVLLSTSGEPLTYGNGELLLASAPMCMFDWPITSMVTGNNQLGMITTFKNAGAFTTVSYIGKPAT